MMVVIRFVYLILFSAVSYVFFERAQGFSGCKVQPFVCSRDRDWREPRVRHVYALNTPSLETVSNIDAAEQELLRSIQGRDRYFDNQKNNESNVPSLPTASSFQTIIDNWIQISDPERAESLVDTMELFHAPSGRIYEKIIDAWCMKALNQGEELRGQLAENRDIHSNQIAKNGLDAANKALALLDRLEELHDATGDNDYRPALSTYTKVTNTFIRINTLFQNEKLRSNINSIIERLRQRRDSTYNYHQYEMKFLPNSEEEIYKIIQQYEGGTEILDSVKTGATNFSLATPKICNRVIHALALSKRSWAGLIAEIIFDYMVAHSIQPDIITFNECIHAWALSPDVPYAADRAEKMLEKLYHIQNTNGLLLDIQPDKISYNTIIQAYANTGNWVRADAILTTMDTLYQNTGDEKVRPDLISYSCVLHSYARASKTDAGAAKRAEDLLAQMYKQYKTGINPDIQPTTILFNNVINAHAERGSGIRAMMLLILMEDMSLRDDGNNVRPDIYTYNSVLKAIAKSNENGAMSRAEKLLKKLENSHRIKPDIISYNTFIDIIARCGGRGAGRKAEELLAKLADLGLNANAATYTSVINAWTNSGDNNSLRRSEALIRRLMEHSLNSPFVESPLPNTSIYNALLKCACKNVSTQKALDILSSMESFESRGMYHLSPNAQSYTMVIDSIASDGKPDTNSCDNALGILDRMISRFNQGSLDVRPNVVTYSSVIKCYAKSKLKEKAQKALQILQRMEEDYRSGNNSARPNIVAYNSLLNACAYSSKEHCAEEAFRIACLIFDEIRTSDHVRATHVSFATFLKVVHNMMPESEMKNDLIEGVFRRCSRDGLCSQLVMNQLAKTASPVLLSKLIHGGDMDIAKIPVYWTRNVSN